MVGFANFFVCTIIIPILFMVGVLMAISFLVIGYVLIKLLWDWRGYNDK